MLRPSRHPKLEQLRLEGDEASVGGSGVVERVVDGGMGWEKSLSRACDLNLCHLRNPPCV